MGKNLVTWVSDMNSFRLVWFQSPENLLKIHPCPFGQAHTSVRWLSRCQWWCTCCPCFLPISLFPLTRMTSVSQEKYHLFLSTHSRYFSTVINRVIIKNYPWKWQIVFNVLVFSITDFGFVKYTDSLSDWINQAVGNWPLAVFLLVTQWCSLNNTWI